MQGARACMGSAARVREQPCVGRCGGNQDAAVGEQGREEKHGMWQHVLQQQQQQQQQQAQQQAPLRLRLSGSGVDLQEDSRQINGSSRPFEEAASPRKPSMQTVLHIAVFTAS